MAHSECVLIWPLVKSVAASNSRMARSFALDAV